MYPLVETIKLIDGKPVNRGFHIDRINRSRKELFGITRQVDERFFIDLISSETKGIFKCRVLYGEQFGKPEFTEYQIRPVTSLKIVKSDSIDYSYKYSDRKSIDELFAMRGSCDDILIVKNGLVADTSYANVIFLDKNGNWVTPDSPLLEGTKRAYLINSRQINKTRITTDDISSFIKVKLINAMIDPEDTEGLPVSKIIF